MRPISGTPLPEVAAFSTGDAGRDRSAELWRLNSCRLIQIQNLLPVFASMPRSRLGPLAIEAKLGDRPSQSSVWRAIRAAKQLLGESLYGQFGGTPEARAFAEEWEVLKQIQHPAIVNATVVDSKKRMLSCS